MKTTIKPTLALKQLVFYASDDAELKYLAKEQEGRLLQGVLALAHKAQFENLLFLCPESAMDFKRRLDQLAIHYPLRLVSSFCKKSESLWSKLLDVQSDLAAEFYLSDFPNWGFASQLAALSVYQADLVLAVGENRHFMPAANQLPAWVQVNKNYLTAASWLKIADYCPTLGTAKISRSWLQMALNRLVAGERLAQVLDDLAQDQLIKVCFFQAVKQQPIFGERNYFSLSEALLNQALASW